MAIIYMYFEIMLEVDECFVRIRFKYNSIGNSLVRLGVIAYPENLSDVRKTKVVSDFRKTFLGQSVCMLEMRIVSDFSGQCFGYHIPDIVSDIRKAIGFVMTLCLSRVRLKLYMKRNI